MCVYIYIYKHILEIKLFVCADEVKGFSFARYEHTDKTQGFSFALYTV